MNKDTIDYGGAEVIDHKSQQVDPDKLVPMPDPVVSALEKMPHGERMAWWRRNRPTLVQLAQNPAGLSASQQKAVDKQARKRAARWTAAAVSRAR